MFGNEDNRTPRSDILEIAYKAVCADRNDSYGSPEDNFATIADLWSIYLDRQVAPRDVAVMMVLLKVARVRKGKSIDSWIDIAGYAACGGELDLLVEEMRREHEPIDD
jgi:hypothetical protein